MFQSQTRLRKPELRPLLLGCDVVVGVVFGRLWVLLVC